jgi:hypothetical protein
VGITQLPEAQVQPPAQLVPSVKALPLSVPAAAIDATSY